MIFLHALLFVTTVFAATLNVGGVPFELNEKFETRMGANGTFAPAGALLAGQEGKAEAITGAPGKFSKTKPNEIVLEGSSQGWKRKLRAWLDPKFPGAVLLQSTYTNLSKQTQPVLGWNEADGFLAGTSDRTPWAYLPASYTERPNWLQPLPEGSSKKNFLGMNATDYGGGTPLAAIWNNAEGLAVGVLESEPKEISLLAENISGKRPHLAVMHEHSQQVKPGESVITFRSFLLPFHGDPYSALEKFSRYINPAMHARSAPKSTMGPIWCAWGYGREFTPEQLLATLPKAKELGFEWVGIDDGWQETIGDWTPNRKKFPGGDKDFKKLVDEIHRQGFKVQLWWAPLAVHKDSAYVKKFPQRLLRNPDGKPRDITWWDAWYLCPADRGVERDMAQLAKKFVKEWGIDGFKLDGQHLNASAPCFEKAHHHRYPEVSSEQHARVQKAIYEAALSAKKDTLVEACPCGANFSVFNLPWQNLTVASDPLDSVQVRQKGKVLRALSGESSVFFGDHVELTRGDGDFASTVGTGGLVGSNFTLASQNPPPPPPEDPSTVLTPEREAHWKKWLKIAKEYPLWKGKYRGELYDLAFALPETHAVEYKNRMHYGFFAPAFEGKVELKGLNPAQRYEIEDYENGKVLATVNGASPLLEAKFTHHLLVVAKPVSQPAPSLDPQATFR